MNDGAKVWRQAAASARSNRLEELLAWHIKAWGLPTPERELRFHPERQWRFDFAWPAWRLAVEVEGITAAGGRHQRKAGYEADTEKYNAATLAGWTLLRFTAGQVQRAEAVRLIERALHQAKGRGLGPEDAA